MLGDMQSATVKRNNLRTQLERGKSRATGQPVAEGRVHQRASEGEMARAPRRPLPVPGARAVGVLAGRSAHDNHGQGSHHLSWSEEKEEGGG